MARHPEIAQQYQESRYEVPFRFARRLDNVLIVGAGARNDAAAALRNGALLLETQMISRLALYFGNTWLVTCVALTAILLVLVLANVYVLRYRPDRLGPYYGLLVIFLIAAYFIPWQQLPLGARVIGILLSAAYSVPIFFAGVVFAETFRRSEHKSDSFGANILGAIAGGLSQNLSFILGMKALLGVCRLFLFARRFLRCVSAARKACSRGSFSAGR